MSYIIDEQGNKLWDSTSEFTEEELKIINLAGVTVPRLRDFYARFPHQDLETAIAGCIQEMAAYVKGLITPISEEAALSVDEPVYILSDDGSSKLSDESSKTT